MSLKKNSLILSFLLAILLSLNLTSCHSRRMTPPDPIISNEDVMWAILPYAINLQHDKKLILEDSKIHYGPLGSSITKISLDFSSQSILELREARGLLVDVVEGLLDAVNNDPTLGLPLEAMPVSVNELEICFKFESYHGLYVDKRYVHWIKLEDNTSFFYAFDLTNEFDIWDRDCECWHQRIEPYNQSRQIVMIERVAEEAYAELHHKPESTTFTGESYSGKADITTGRTEAPL